MSSKIYPNVTLKAFIPCSTSDAPLAQIDAAIVAGQPAIGQVDSSPAAGIQTYWVVIYERKGDDYLMLDPWPYSPGTDKEDYLMKRYAQGRTLQRAISHVILYEAYGSGGPITPPSTPSTSTTPPSTPTTDSTTPSGPYARVKADVTWGLNVRSSLDTSSMANVVVAVPAGTQLSLLESEKYLRRRAGLTQRELSIAVNYSDTQISRLEQNERMPDLATLTARFLPVLHIDDQPEVAERLVELAATMRREDAPAAGLPPYRLEVL